MKQYEASAEVFGECLLLLAKLLDDGAVVELYGGCRTHVGAVCCAAKGKMMQSVRLDTHKEYLITEKWAPRLSQLWNRPVTMLCGIHYHQPSREMLAKIVSAADGLLETLSAWQEAR